MANQNTIAIELIVKDNGSVIVKQFGAESQKSLQGMGKDASGASDAIAALKNNWITATAAVAASLMVIAKAKEYMEIGAKAQQAADSFRIVGKSAGYSAEELENFKEKMSAAAAGTVDDSDIMQKAVKGITLGLSLDQLTRIMEAARVSARVTGEDVKTAYETITDAIATGLPRALKRYGLVSKEEMAAVEAALQAGVADVDLYEMAMSNATIQGLKFGEMHETNAEKIQKAKARIVDFTESIGVGLIEALSNATSMFSRMTTASEDAATLMAGGFVDSVKLAANSVMKFDSDEMETILFIAEQKKKSEIEALKEKTEATIAAKKLIEDQKKAVEQALQAMAEDTRKTNVEIEGIGKSQFDKDMARINSQAAEYLIKSKDKIKTAEWTTAQIALAEAKQAEETKKLRFESTSEYLLAQEKETQAKGEAMNKKFFAEKAATEKIKEILAGEYEFAATENERAINKIIADATRKVTEIEKLVAEEGGNAVAAAEAIIAINENKNRAILEKETENAIKISRLNFDLIKDIKGMEKEAFDMKVLNIQAEMQKAMDLGAKWEYVAAWGAKKIKEAEQEKLLATGTFFDGVKVGYERMQEQSTTVATLGLETFKTFSTEAGQAFGSNFRDVLKGDFSDLGKAWDNVWGSMLTTLTNTLGKMVAEAIAKDIVMMFKADWTSDSSNVLGIIKGAMNLWNSFNSEADGLATGGPVPQGKPVWVGEKGPELLFTTSPGYVMEHEKSKIYAARNGGFIPGYANGGYFGQYPLLSAGLDDPSDGNIWGQALKDVREPRGFGRHMRFPYDKADSDPGIKSLILDFAEGQRSSISGFETENGQKWSGLFGQGFGDADVMGRLNFGGVAKKVRSFYMDDTYDDGFTTGGMSWLGEFLGVITKTVATVIAAAASAYVAAQTGGAGGAAIGAFMAASSSLVHTKGDWTSAVIAGVLAAVMVGINELFSGADAAAMYDPDITLGTGEGGWQASEEYLAALESNYGNGSTPLWLENLTKGASRFVAKTAVPWAIKTGLGLNGQDGSNRGHATYGYDSTDDQGVFDALAPLMDLIAPKSTALSLNFAGDGFPALNGLDYVPRNKFPILADEGEAVLTKRQADAWRGGNDSAELVAELRGLRADFSGRPSIGQIKIYLDGSEIQGRVKVIADGVIVARNQRGVNATQRVYQ